MKCEKCKIGDLHLSDEIWRFRWRCFWRKPKTVGYVFVCDNCGGIKEVKTDKPKSI